MSWEKIGKFLVGLLGALASATLIYVAFKSDTKLEADLSYRYQQAPRQLSERLDGMVEKLKYANLYDGIKSIANGALNHEQIDKIVDMSQSPYLSTFNTPFENGLDNYPVRLLIHLKNTGSKVVKDVHIKLPAKGLVQIRDDSRSDTVKPEPVSSVVIPSIVQNGEYLLWIYFKGDLNTLRDQGVYIGYGDGVAKIRVYEQVIGLDAGVARYSVELLGALVLFAYLLLVAGYALWVAYKSDHEPE